MGHSVFVMGSDKTVPSGNSLSTSLISAVRCWSILCCYCQQFLQALGRLTSLKFSLPISLVFLMVGYTCVFFFHFSPGYVFYAVCLQVQTHWAEQRGAKG